MTPPAWTISKLLKGIPISDSKGDLKTVVTGLTDDTRNLNPGDLFWATAGAVGPDGPYALEAFGAGANGVVVSDLEVFSRLNPPPDKAVVLAAKEGYLGIAASRYFGNPSSKLKLVGITGTNGKTTVAHMIAHILERGGEHPGIIGTVGYRIGKSIQPAPFTTPFPITFQKLLADMAASGAEWAISEISSHGLHQGRADGSTFHSVIFTNLSRDHLDYHQSMEAYLEAKTKLFSDFPVTSHHVINLDDPVGKQLAKDCRSRLWTYGLGNQARVIAREWNLGPDGLTARIFSPSGDYFLKSPLLGKPGLLNLLAAWAWAEGAGIDPDLILQGLETFRGVPGRMEKVEAGQPFLVLVDYAHTPDALDKTLETVRGLTAGRVIVVFGCGGDRDPGKRAPMGRYGSAKADVAIITSDNPRSEDPIAIINDILAGVPAEKLKNGRVMMVADREAAIRQAVDLAEANDLVLIAGKGHETTQLIGGQVRQFDDRIVARRCILEKWGKGS